ncbi:AAA family ATPase [Algoriella sp.]|uniref:AAA family ATPase n=1 Tax=Algoriella sp. TaxID=1872434 RepID=UPI002FC708AD
MLFYINIQVNGRSIILIFGGGNTHLQKDYLDKIELEFNSLFNIDLNTILNISQISLKAYPSWVLKDEDLWMKIQKNSEFGNLSLLPEQTEFLEKFRFPKYINGQAGSGKSTILYYLFSNIYYYKCAGEIKGELIFLTENENLLTHTINSIYDLITNNPEFQLSQNDTDLINLKKNFNSFKEFLKSFLVYKDDFSDDLYLDFSIFKKRYEDSAISLNIKKKFSAELVWFVITTYIYGFDKVNKITSENFDLLMPKEGKEIINIDDFKTIENEILKPFYDKLINENGYWTKLSLIKYLENNDLVNKKYEVIFCDEAQDFTKVELEFINSISLYNDYNLENVVQYPIVFAGDALQTVNPTGFKSQVLTSMIYKSLTDPKVGFKLDSSDLVFTPKYNYRSSKAIVDLANIIQTWRKVKLNEEISNLQKSKRNDSYQNQNLVVFVDIDEFQNSTEIINKVEYKTIIVPVNNNEIEEYILKYPILKKFKNIISPIDAKGLDFSEVVIFGFGDYTIDSNLGLYEEKFFFNKLYVSVTRSRDELIIIDSLKSKEVFWSSLINNYSIYIDKENNDPINASFDDYIISNSNSIIQSKEYIVEEDAIQQKEIGDLNKNIPILRIASNHFYKIDNLKEYYYCLGIIEEISENYSKASEYFFNKELANDDSAKKRGLMSLWNSNEYNEILEYKHLKNNFKRLIDCISYVIIEKQNLFDENDLEIIEKYQRELYEIKDKSINKKTLINLFIFNIKNNFDNDIVVRSFQILIDQFKSDVILDDIKNLDSVFYDKKLYSQVINLNSNFNIDNPYYYFSRAELSKRKRKHEDYIVNLGKIIYGDFIKNKGFESFINENDIAQQILDYYRDNDLEELEYNDLYFNIYIVVSQLYCEETIEDSTLKLIENDFKNEKRDLELLSFYYYLLCEDCFDNIIYNKALFLWKKLFLELNENNLDNLNIEYKILCELKNYPYSPFTIEEDANSNNILTEIKVENFKQFNNLEIRDLGQFNLIVGDNNIGKTTALEMFLINENESETYNRLLHSYIERSKLIPDRITDSERDDYIFNVNSDFLNTFYTYNSDSNPLITFFKGKCVHKIILNIKKTENFITGYNLYKFSKEKKYNSQLELVNTLNSPLYSFGKGYGNDLGKAFDKYIKEARLENIFKQNLSLFINDIEDVYLNSNGEIRIRIINEDIDKPLYSFGDGANKLFRILMLLTIHKGKTILIDEIDSGIHFSRFQKFWEIIIEVALKDNTQIISTTHNIECLEYLVEALKNIDNVREKARVIKISRTNRLKSVTYDFNNFNLAIEDNIEIRG